MAPWFNQKKKKTPNQKHTQNWTKVEESKRVVNSHISKKKKKERKEKMRNMPAMESLIVDIVYVWFAKILNKGK